MVWSFHNRVNGLQAVQEGFQAVQEWFIVWSNEITVHDAIS